MGITTERVEIATDDGVMGGYLARPSSGGPHPGVLVFMEIFGINAHIRDVCERVAEEGYVTLAPDYFHRTGPGIELGYDDAGFAEGMKHMGALRADSMIEDANAAIRFLRSRKDVRGGLGCMGFCIGGHMAYLTACETPVAATASFYGGGIAAAQGPGGAESTLGRTPRIGGRVLCLQGGRDAFIPPDQVEALRNALAQAGVRHEVVVYDGAEHGFFCDQRASFDEAARDDAWERVKRLFAEELGG